MKTAYSVKTSLPAFVENERGKTLQKEKIIQALNDLNGSACLKQIEQITGLPQSTCAGRMNDAVREGKIKHEGYINYQGRKRKMFVLITPEMKQQSLFSIK